MNLKNINRMSWVDFTNSGSYVYIPLVWKYDKNKYVPLVVADIKGKYNRFYGIVEDFFEVERIIKDFGNNCRWFVKIYNIPKKDFNKLILKSEEQALNILITSGYDYELNKFRSMGGTSKIFIDNCVKLLRYRENQENKKYKKEDYKKIVEIKDNKIIYKIEGMDFKIKDDYVDYSKRCHENINEIVREVNQVELN